MTPRQIVRWVSSLAVMSGAGLYGCSGSTDTSTLTSTSAGGGAAGQSAEGPGGAGGTSSAAGAGGASGTSSGSGGESGGAAGSGGSAGTAGAAGAGGELAGGAAGASGGAAGASGGAAGASGGAAGASGSAGFATACVDLENALCEKLSECDPILITVAYGDVATCKSRASAACAKSVTLAGEGGTAGDVETCAGALLQLSCPALLLGQLPDSCHGKGTLADGAGCADDGQCAGNKCLHKDTNGCGACATPKTSGPCDPGVAAECASGYYCDSQLKACSKSVAMGGSCAGDNASCQAGLKCVGGVCSELLAEGAACDPQDSACDIARALYCNYAKKTCQPFGVAKPGEPCGFDSQTFVETLCDAGGQCIPSSAMSPMGTCLAPLADGASCTASSTAKTDPCTPPAKCLGGVCHLGSNTVCN